jgi:hypothetical protein
LDPNKKYAVRVAGRDTNNQSLSVNLGTYTFALGAVIDLAVKL